MIKNMVETGTKRSSIINKIYIMANIDKKKHLTHKKKRTQDLI